MPSALRRSPRRAAEARAARMAAPAEASEGIEARGEGAEAFEARRARMDRTAAERVRLDFSAALLLSEPQALRALELLRSGGALTGAERDDRGWPALCAALRDGRKATARWLLGSGLFDASARGPGGEDACTLALRRRWWDLFEELVGAGAALPPGSVSRAFAALPWTLPEHERGNLLRALGGMAERGACLDARDAAGKSALGRAIEREWEWAGEWLVAMGANPRAALEAGALASEAAAQKGLAKLGALCKAIEERLELGELVESGEAAGAGRRRL